MLEEKLQPLLTQLRREDKDFKGKYEIVRRWFRSEESVVDKIEDLTFLCELPTEERKLLTYPVIGNWVLKQMEQFQPQTEYQMKVYELMRKVISEGRFKNSHMEGVYDNPVEFTRVEDELLSTMLVNPDESMTLHKFMSQIGDAISDAVYNDKLSRKGTYTTDLGHGLVAPVRNLTSFVATSFERLVRWGGTKPLNLAIMVVDDENPTEWYHRLLSVGFNEIKGQQGVFYNAETALEALEQVHYDVILTDIELGQGKMDGIEFTEKAYEIQRRKGITPRISVFSFNKDKLREAEERLRPRNGEQKVMHQIDLNYKSRWTATNFKQEVLYALRREIHSPN